jgi:putative tryptophan/tyrosine transport system substrate-binding protein
MRLIGLAVTLAVSVLASIAVEAQTLDKVYHIGVLERTAAAIYGANLEGFRQGLRSLGYVEGKNLVIEYRSADGRDERFPELAVTTQ